MKRTVLTTSALVALLFGAVALMKNCAAPASPVSTGEVAVPANTDREQTRRFWALYREATRHRIAGRFDSARTAYQRALQLDGGHEDALYYLGNANLELGRFDEASAAWHRLTGVNPRSARAYGQLGTLQLCFAKTDVFDLEEADAAFRRAHALNPEETGPPLYLGEIALLRGDYGEARRHFEAVAATNDRSAAARLFLGYVAWKDGRADAAAAHLAAATGSTAPAATAEPQVAGEGDTETGDALVSGRSGCPLFDAPLAALRGVPGDPSPDDVDRTYRQVDASLGRVRTDVSAP